MFRGRLNKESGILNIIEQFDNFTKSSNKKESLKLVIQGWGDLSNEVNYLLDNLNNKSIILIPYFISNTFLINLVKRSSAIVGQFNNHQNRLNFTIPNKFYEALFYNKLYLTPIMEPLKNPYLNLLSNHIPLIKNPNYFSEWLLKNSDLIYKINSGYDDFIKSISKSTLSKYYSHNQKLIDSLN